MTVTKVDSVKANGTDSATTSAINTTGAAVLVAIMDYYYAGPGSQPGVPPLFYDNKGNKWIQGTLRQQSAGAHVMFRCVAPIVGTNHIFYTTANGSYASCLVLALATDAASITFDASKESGATQSSGTSISPGSLTSSAGNAVFVTGCQNGGTAPTAGSSFTTEQSYAFVASTSIGGGIAWKYNAGAASTENPSWSWSTNVNNDGNASMMAFIEGGNLSWGVDDFLSKEIVPRDNGQTYSVITYSGTYNASGTTPVTIEVQIEQNGAGTVLQAYTALSNMTLVAGHWFGTMQTPKGDGYQIKARFKNGGGTVISTSSATTNFWGVGTLGEQSGQSHLPHMEDDVNSPPSANAGGRVFDGTSWTNPAGNGNIALLNGLVSLFAGTGLGGTDEPFGMVRTGIGGAGWGVDGGGAHDGGYYSGGQWSLDTSWYQPMPLLRRKTSALREHKPPNYVFVAGGSSDAVFGRTYAQIYADEQTVRGLINTWHGLSSSQLPWLVLTNARALDGTSAAAWQTCKDADLAMAANQTNCKLIANLVDLALADEYHLTAIAYGHACCRSAQSIGKFYGATSIDGVSLLFVSGNRYYGSADIYLTTNESTQLNKADGTTTGASLTGFEASSDGFSTPLTISSTAFVQPNKIKLTLSTPPANGDNVVVRYLYGAAPTITTPTYDSLFPVGDNLYKTLLYSNSQTGNWAITAGNSPASVTLLHNTEVL